jgi:hypothetical protein
MTVFLAKLELARCALLQARMFATNAMAIIAKSLTVLVRPKDFMIFLMLQMPPLTTVYPALSQPVSFAARLTLVTSATIQADCLTIALAHSTNFTMILFSVNNSIYRVQLGYCLFFKNMWSYFL